MIRRILCAFGLPLIILAFFTVIFAYSYAETPKPAPKYKFGDRVLVTLPFYRNCSSGVVTELNPFSVKPVLTHCYYVEDIECPIYDKSLRPSEWRHINLVVNEENLSKDYHIMEPAK